MGPNTGKYLVLIGGLILVVGLLVWSFPGLFNKFGRLPGDIRVEREHFRFYFPLTTMILLSLVLTLIVNLLRRFF
ncbi:DUF2905 domain-containing protein [Flaviaesturariibacter flavus]|uniref:DUF2905 domain-containing protein n=1 Tax=Flaviaesturariibacter flavus TaxID=2502780 RepID=A0A4R1B4S4_9BACT|nr:DUF2905 domain-containing protein [Flaviaesturariibacter flavus]TCJ13112.1 DUF2905 domain-containing protein [Flaviaesturariibacter flavus]